MPTHWQPYNGQGSPTSEYHLHCQKWSQKGRGALSTPVCVKKERNGQATADQGFFVYSQPRQLPCAWLPKLKTHPPLHIPPFLLAQNLSLKRISPNDNMLPMLHDEYTCHQWLKLVTHNGRATLGKHWTKALDLYRSINAALFWQLLVDCMDLGGGEGGREGVVR